MTGVRDLITDRLVRACLVVLFVLASAIASKPASAADDDAWTELKGTMFDERQIGDGSHLLAIEAPYRAHDAALVPIEITALKPQSPDAYIKTITLVIDKNPAPVAAVFHLAPESGLASISTRVRVNAYSDIRAIAETSDGALHMVSRFVKASGGCSAPAQKDLDESLAKLGIMKLRRYTPIPTPTGASGPIHEAQLMIRHPNTTGLQMDQVTGYYIPAHFVDEIEIRLGDRTVLSIEGAISLSENPTVRFHFVPQDDADLSAHVEDTDGNVFQSSWPVAPTKAIN
jgi:sulfur-oxidizing protein SoxY